jgi:hypothetical protein
MAACPALGAMGTKELTVYCEGKKCYEPGPTRATKAGQKYPVPTLQAQEPIKEGPLSYELLESPFTSV